MAAYRLDLAGTLVDARRLLRADHEAILAIAGMFILLPGIVSGWLLPMFRAPRRDATAAEIVQAISVYVNDNWLILSLSAIVAAFGSLALLAHVLHARRPTVAEALRIALRALPFYIVAGLVQGLILIGGFMLFVLPGAYLAGRLICIMPVAVAEGERRPIAMVARSFLLTRGNGWRILLMQAMLMVGFILLSSFAGAIAAVLGLALPQEVARLLAVVLDALVDTVLAVAVAMLGAAVYRQAHAPRR